MTPAAREAERVRRGRQLAAGGCRLLLSVLPVATAAAVTRPPAPAQHEQHGRGTLVRAEKPYTLAGRGGRWGGGAPARAFTPGRRTPTEQAVTAHTEHCRTALRRNGVNARVVDVGAADHHGSRHLGCEAAAAPPIVRWFGELARS
ncbi:hypothetical protein AB0C13_14845 [Streptomyces sp. NPDC049099]|uniref:hypothetical protein n=1 Tax=Streptomyces sp. NPDC049099 TaxID=3155768 RepID=UPI00343DC0C4